MKKLLFIVFLAPLMLLAQADFRGMSWGDSFERLQELNPTDAKNLRDFIDRIRESRVFMRL